MLHFPRVCLFSLLVLGPLAFAATAQEPVPLIAADNARQGWSFNNGAEFPGATGTLTADAAGPRAGSPCLKLVGDFTKGGGYVQAGRAIDNVDIRELAFWVRNPDADRLTLRLSDATGQTHQIVLATEPGGEWQRVVLPLERFFARRGQADAVTSVAKYESWGGAKDGRWHGPAQAIYFLVSNRGANRVRTLWLADVVLSPRPTAVPGAETRAVVPLAEIIEGEHDWRFSHGAEFPGAKGSLSVAAEGPRAGESCLKLAGDFAGGGAYVAAIKSLELAEAKATPAFRLQVKTANAASVGVQIVDATGQTHQRKDVPLRADDQWHELVLKPAEIAGGEHWGGANDGQFHGAARQLVISLTGRSDAKGKRPVLLLADVRAEALLPVFAQPAAFTAKFDAPLDKGWTATRGAAIDPAGGSQQSGGLLLARSLADLAEPCSALSPSFAAAPGQWEIRLACKADLTSPDNSYRGVAVLEALDRNGKQLEAITLADLFGKRDWQPIRKTVELPAGVAQARLRFELLKAHGKFWIDDVSAAYLAPAAPRDDRIARLLFSTAALGNLLFPEDSRAVQVTVEAKKPLRESQLALAYVVRDYWGAEQTRPAVARLDAAEKKNGLYQYRASLDLGAAPLAIGRYYELHAAIPQGDGALPQEPFRNHTSLAILPEAGTRKFKPEEVPFTSRNWDNRISEYIRLSDRLGVRICGLWGGWSDKPPYKPEAPGLELCRSLGMGWLTTTPAKFIEAGSKDRTYDEQALRQGARNFLEKYAGERPLIINLGNEPHGTGERVRANVAAYKAIYEEVKRFDASLPVVATSVEPNAEYFENGYGQWCDAYDFHIYEDHEKVRRTIGQYRELMQKHSQVKPIWSTELGLNSQGLPRQVVAGELIRKFATFFAAGGANVSWFGLLYPDPDGKQHGSSGDAHNVFDCRFNRYCPRLDAVAYYHAVNAIAIKKFVEENEYAGGVRAFLFRDRDGRQLQVLWTAAGRRDVRLPLAGAKEVEVIRIDGSRRSLEPDDTGATITVTGDPLLVLYAGGPQTLPAELPAPAATIDSPLKTVPRGAAFTLQLALNGGSLKATCQPPPHWTVQSADRGAGDARRLELTLMPPAGTEAREVEVAILLDDSAGRPRGELYFRAPVAN